MRSILGWWLCCWVVTLAVASELTIEEQEKQYKESLDWAESVQMGIPATAADQLNIKDYCADRQCVDQVNNPPQKSLDDAGINRQKTGEFSSSDHAGAIQNHFDKGRPKVKNDPAFEFALIGQENAYDITHGLSNQYVDCNSGSQCITEFIPKLCNAPTHANVPCDKTPTASVITDSVIYSCPAGWTGNGTDCSQTVTECRYDSNNQVVVYSGSGWCARNGTHYTWDGQYVDPSQGFTRGELINRTSGSCNGSSISEDYQICGPVLKTLPATMSCNSGYTLSGGNCIKNVFTWKKECSLISDCHVMNEQCIEGKETRTINGIPTTLDCWKYQINHQCDLPDSCASLPADCKTTAHTCSLRQNGVCVENEFQKSCPRQRCSTTDLVCGETSFCLDGDCYNPISTQNTEFDQSAAALAGLNAAGKDLGNPPTMFRGKPMKCTDKAFGFADCCKDGGWGTDMGLAQCDEEEKALGQAKEKKLTIALGDYCAEKVLGACIRRKKTYCVYDSKLARIIQEQGNKNQLSSHFGDAENPVCDPITPEQLQEINFGHIDFGDFYEDMHNNMALPNPEEIKNRIKSALSED